MLPNSEFFPSKFLKAATVVWDERAKSFLNGIKAAVDSNKEESVVAARAWLASQSPARLFLEERGLKAVYNAVGHTGKVVDLVLESLSKRLILVEAKSFLDSGQLRRSFQGRSKFENSLGALKRFYEKGGEHFPGVEKLMITASAIHISGRSTWSINDDDRLAKNGIELSVENLPVLVQQIRF